MRKVVACVEGVRNGRERELGRETTRSRAPKFPFPLLTPATQAREVAAHGYLIVFFDLRKSRNAVITFREHGRCFYRQFEELQKKIHHEVARSLLW